MNLVQEASWAGVADLLARPDAIPVVLMVALLVLFSTLSLSSRKRG
ncbi:MAG: hypothetical protein IT384_21345 [Deltaproteobacteria bacterium]|nr:hypothetical protein [Deltaproteobacteria bacterium]